METLFSEIREVSSKEWTIFQLSVSSFSKTSVLVKPVQLLGLEKLETKIKCSVCFVKALTCLTEALLQCEAASDKLDTRLKATINKVF